ncbi:hypothetical protein JTB14_002690 [Gonioctena quinquepunctata]|nr:hypothetical protein JTB14_002690 [Gonioctena quinquepunctata]
MHHKKVSQASKMKCVLLLSLVALCYSVPLTPVSPIIDFGVDGTITITGVDGRKAVISSADESKNVEVLLTTPLGFKKLVKVDEEKNIGTIKVQDPTIGNWNQDDVQRYGGIFRPEYVSSKSQYDILEEIFRGCQSVVDPTTLENVLIKLEYYLESGALEPYVYQILKFCLEDNIPSLEKLFLEQGDITTRQINEYQMLPLLRYFLNKKTEQERPYGSWYEITPASVIVQENPQLFRNSYGQQLQYQQQLIEPQQQLTPSQVYGSLPWNQVEEPQQWVGPQQYTYEQQRPSLDQYLAKLQLAQVLPWSMEFQEQQRPSLDQYLAKLQLTQVLPWNRQFQEQQQYYGSQQAQPLQLPQSYQQLTPLELPQELYEPYEQQIGVLQEDGTQRGQSFPWNRYQVDQTYYPKENIWQRKMTPLQWRQRDYSLNTPFAPIA